LISPEWTILADSVINQYHEGRISLEYAEKKLDDLRVPQSIKNRLYKQKKEQNEQ